ncbi:radical SAM protein [Desulfobacter sp.]|uniref:radical SAM/SPASM domain-containing protein n=1 Tax=Desulfobacter sp. TaxID=2294 RepID=UPI00257B9F74|nr:radical SAM protein [Desulfobacter sp.]
MNICTSHNIGCAGNFEFSKQKIDRAVSGNRLLSMEIELSLRCNFRCSYCYVPHDAYFDNELSLDEIFEVIIQAKALGAGKIILLGGEPSIYPHIREVIEFLKSHHLETEIFTNGTGITPDFSRELRAAGVRVVLKMNSFDEARQDALAGKKGAFHIIHNALGNLKAAGYPAKDAFLALSTIICRQNRDELINLWTWIRDNNMAPYFEIITPQGQAKNNTSLELSPLELKVVFEEICAVDRERYGIEWDPQPPLMGNQCMRHQFSCTVTSIGNVQPCVGITKSIGNIRETRLKDILDHSRELRLLKNHRQTIKGYCRTCEKNDICYGCRGAAFQVTGDLLASDPLCWRNPDNLKPKI